MNVLGYYNIGAYNTNSPIINTNQPSTNPNPPTPPIGSAYIYNKSDVGITTQGLIPIYDGANQSETTVSENIRQTNLGITISNLQVNSDVSTNATTSLNNFIVNVSSVLRNAFSINVNP